jgi:hypothetical protein
MWCQNGNFHWQIIEKIDQVTRHYVDSYPEDDFIIITVYNLRCLLLTSHHWNSNLTFLMRTEHLNAFTYMRKSVEILIVTKLLLLSTISFLLLQLLALWMIN